MRPGGGLVVEGAGFQASVQDADESAGQPPQGVMVFDSAGAEPVVAGAGAGRCGHHGIGQAELFAAQGGQDRVGLADDAVAAGTTSRQRSTLPVTARGTISTQGSKPRGAECSPVGGHQAPTLPDGRPVNTH